MCGTVYLLLYILTHLQPLRGLPNVLTCRHSCCVIVLDVFFYCFYVFISYILVMLAQFCAILLFYGHLSVQEFLPWCSSSQCEINWNWQEAQLSPRDRAMRRVNWNLANCHATVQKLLIRQVLTESMVWSWRFSRRQCVIDNVHSTMTRPCRLPLSQVS